VNLVLHYSHLGKPRRSWPHLSRIRFEWACKSSAVRSGLSFTEVNKISGLCQQYHLWWSLSFLFFDIHLHLDTGPLQSLEGTKGMMTPRFCPARSLLLVNLSVWNTDWPSITHIVALPLIKVESTVTLGSDVQCDRSKNCISAGKEPADASAECRFRKMSYSSVCQMLTLDSLALWSDFKRTL
jgi:hypothetical protein